MMSNEIVDLEELIRNWASDSFRRAKQEIGEIESSDIDWKHARISHEPALYKDESTLGSPRTEVLMTATFVNKTDQPQVFVLNNQRRTTSVCNICMTRGLTKGVTLDFKIQPPNPVVEANAGFKGEMSIKSSNEETFREQMIWSVNSDIHVPPKMKVKAELVLTEVEYNSNFACKTRVDGIISLLVRNKSNSYARPISTHVSELLGPENGFLEDQAGLYFVSKGECKCRFGIEQHVRLQEMPL